MANTRKRKTAEPVINDFASMPEAPTEPAVEAPSSTCIGVVKDCEKLNIRANPNSEAKILGRLTKNAAVVIDKSASNKDFYKVTTESGIDGYCMKKYISIKK